MATPKQVRRAYRSLSYNLRRLRRAINKAEDLGLISRNGPYVELVCGRLNEISLQIDKEFSSPMATAMRQEIKAEIK